MNKYLVSLLICTFCFCAFAEAQVGVYIGPRIGYGPVYGRGYRHRPQRRQQQNLPKFQPTVNVSFGYGFPNLDKDQLPDFYNLYKGTTTSQTGHIKGQIFYRFSRNMSMGVLFTHENESFPY